MTIAFRAVNPMVGGTVSSFSFTHPTGSAVNDMLFACLGAKPFGSDCSSGTFLTAYTLTGNKVSGARANAVDSGSIRCHVRHRIMQSGDVAPSVTLGTAASPRMSSMIGYSIAPGATWSIVSTTGADTDITTTARSITADATLDLAPNDVVVIFVTGPSDAATGTGRTLTAAGFTFSALTQRQNLGSTAGNDGVMQFWEATVLTGSGAATLVLADTVSAAAASEASAVFTRLREIPPPAVTDYWGSAA
jgi:hypothetical protein